MEPTSLLIDQGNSQLKWALINTGQLSFIASGQCETLKAFQHQLVAQNLTLDTTSWVWISSVAKQAQQAHLSELLADYALTTYFVKTPSISQISQSTQALKAPQLINGYDNPAQLGVDRWLALLAIGHDYGYPCVLVDAGSALTLDYVDANGQHHGGWILPGLAKSEQCLTAHTRLSEANFMPQGNAKSDDSVPLKMGTCTTQGIQAGLLAGVLGAIDRFIQLAINQQSNDSMSTQMQATKAPLSSPADALNLVICGGEAPLIQPFLSGAWHYAPNLVLKGLALYAQSNQQAKSS